MIKLINNEFKKNGIYKIIISQIIFLLIIFIIKESGNDLNEYIFGLIPFIGIICSIFFGGIISNEGENGTLRFYLTKPVKRWKIYLAKFLCIIIYLLLIIFLIIGVYFLMNKKIEYSFILNYIKYCIPLFLIASIILLLSNIFKNTSIVVGLSIFILCFGMLISQLLFEINFTYIEYSFLPYLDYSIFDDIGIIEDMNNTFNTSLSMKNGIIIDLLFMFIFYIIGNFYFNKKDIRS